VVSPLKHLALEVGTQTGWSRLQRCSLFWHFLDIVWIGIFSVVYLPGML
jgi:cytochrome o ubiquinol oxidase subunit 3